MIRRGVAAAAFAVVIGVAAVSSVPAAAAADSIGLSHDGVTFAPQYAGNLFGGAEIVPGGSVTRSFWVKNEEATAGNLAVAVRDVAGADGVFISALSMIADAGTGAGAPVRLSEVQPCVSLRSGVTLAASGITRVDVTLQLSSALVDREAQGSIGAFDIAVTLTSTDVAAPDGCTPPVAPSPTPSPTGAPAPSPTRPGAPGGEGGTGTPGFVDTVVVPGAGGGSATPTPVPEPTPSESPAPELPHTGGEAGGDGLYWNTDRFFQEYFVAWWLVALILGAAYAWYRDRRHERSSE